MKTYRSESKRSQEKGWLTLIYLFVGVGAFLTLIFALNLQASSAAAQVVSPTPTADVNAIPLPDFPPNRRTVLNIRTTVYHHWMLTRLEGQKVKCNIYKAVIGEPTDAEVLGYCGFSVYLQWQQGICKDTLDRQETCTGLTLHYIGPINEQLKVQIKIPGPLAFTELVNCSPWSECDLLPQMQFGGYEPLNSERIETVHIEFENEQEVVCSSWECTVDMPLTDANGIEVTYYVSSSYGDNSLKETFLMRNIVLADGRYLFQLIDTKWDNQIPADAAHWKFFPDLDYTLTPWLEAISTPDQLYTEHEYSLLAGVLILRGEVSAAQCPDGGLLPNRAASSCGVEAARDEVIRIQNSFNQLIFDAAQSSRIPARLLKGVIGQESQFWNGWVIPGEYGYGMMTDKGADLLLTWDLSKFLDLCVPAFGERDCAWGYSFLADYPQAYLRGKALQPLGTDAEFELIGQTLAAAAGQTGQMVRNVTGREPGDLLDYKELWRISVAVYHGGGGCVGTAMENAWEVEEELSWGIITEYLQGDCQLISSYPYWVTSYAVNAP